MKKVLVIDDEPLIRKTTGILLRMEHIEAVCAASGREGLDVAAREQPAAIFLDVIMPDMDGWEVLRRLKADAATASIPVVLFTAADTTGAQEQGKPDGAFEVLQKPFQHEELVDLLRKLGLRDDSSTTGIKS